MVALDAYSLRKLIDEEIIHQIPSAMTPRKIRDTYKAFHIDYGNYIDWLESRRLNIEDMIDTDITPTFGSDCEKGDYDLNNYLIDPALLYGENLILCKNCKGKIDENHPVFLKHQECPICAEPVEKFKEWLKDQL